ncbi:MAG: PAS domain S-box protein [Cyclobacteriaceae bacterium]|nr:PAS domain S-box protein [Cyclobacteriaceae bacterium]
MIFRKPILFGILVGVLLLGLTQFLTFQRYLLSKEAEQIEITSELEKTKERIQIALNRSLTTTKILGFLVEKYGVPNNFDSVAMQLLESNEFIDAIQLTRIGVITHVYPLQGNEAVINYDILSDSMRSKEANKAIANKELFFSGPFELKQGGLGIVGRQPIFKDGNFWGFSAVIIKLSTLINRVGLDNTKGNKAIYQFSKINPNTFKEEFFLPEVIGLTKGNFIKVVLPDGAWNLYAQPKKPTQIADFWLLIFLGISLSCIAGLLAWNFAREPKKMRQMISEKTAELHDSIRRFQVLSSINERRIDRFTAAEQATEFTNQVREAFGVDACTIHLIDGNELKLLGSIGVEKHELEDVLPLAHPYLDKIIKEKKVLTIEDTRTDNNFNPDAKFKYSSCAGAPLLAGINVLGVVKLYVRKELRTFSRLELEHLQMAARQFAHVVENTGLYNQNEKHKEVLVKQIIARKNTELVLKESEDKFRGLAEQSLTGIYIIEGEYYKYVNPRFAEIFGYSTDELLRNFKAADTVYGPDLEMVRDTVNKRLAGESVKSQYAFRGIKKDGTIIHVEVFGKAAKTGNSTITIGTLLDVTDRVQSAQLILESEKKYRSLIEQASDPILLYSFDGTIHEFNTSAWSISGYTKEEFANLKLTDILVGDVILNQEKYAAQLRNESVTIERKLRKKDGLILDMEINARMLEDGKMLAFARDITDRKKAVKELAENENYLRTILETEPECVKVLNPKGELISMNPAGLAMIEAENEQQVLKQRMVDLVDKNYQVAFKKLTKNVFTGVSGKLEFEITGLKGTHRWLETHAVPMKDIEGNIISLLGVTRDITERKKGDTERRLLLERNQQIISTMLDGFILADTRGRIIEVNPAYCKMIGYTHNELLLKNINEIEATLSPAEINERIAVMLKQKSVQFETTHIRKDGALINLEVSISIMVVEGQQLVAAFVRDITERKKSEELIRQSEEKFKAAFYASPDSISITSLKTGKLLEVNRGFTETFGFTREEAVEKSAYELGINRNPPDRYKIEQYFETKGMVQNAEVLFYTKANEARSCLSSVVKLEWGNEPCLLSIIKDVTESKKAEHEIVAMNKQLRELSTHLQNIREEERANISREIHDELGQQLTGLRMDISWLNKKIIPNENAIEEKMEDMLGLIDSTIKTVRRISTELRPGILDDLGLLAALDWQSQEFEKRTGIKTKFNSPVRELELNKAITTGIFRVYQESLTNVARHSGAQEVESFLDYADNELVLTIRDNGIGLQDGFSDQRRTLGIVGMKERAMMMGGELQIKGVTGIGTSVTLRVPLFQNPV